MMHHHIRVTFAAVVFDCILPMAMAHTYHGPAAGSCRGPGDSKVNSKYIHERNETDCRQDCDDENHCTGYAYHPTANGGECLVYGPGMAGSCSDDTATSPTACAALGTCENPSFLSEDACGSCSKSSATSSQTCASVLGTWAALTWTSAGATWNDPEDPWIGDYHESTIVSGVTSAAAGYECWDVDATDHHATCTGTADTGGSAACTDAFNGQTESDMVASNCPSGCTFTAAVKAPKSATPHAPATQFPGYEVWAGVCRGPGGAKPTGKYSNTAGAGGGVLTETECMQACEDEPTCIAYAHSTAWCLVYGPGIHETPGDSWTADEHTETTVVTTKPNVAYICGVKSSGDDTGEVNGVGRPELRSTLVLAVVVGVTLARAGCTL